MVRVMTLPVRQLAPDQLERIKTQREIVIADARALSVIPCIMFHLLRATDDLIKGQNDE